MDSEAISMAAPGDRERAIGRTRNCLTMSITN